MGYLRTRHSESGLPTRTFPKRSFAHGATPGRALLVALCLGLQAALPFTTGTRTTTVAAPITLPTISRSALSIADVSSKPKWTISPLLTRSWPRPVLPLRQFLVAPRPASFRALPSPRMATGGPLTNLSGLAEGRSAGSYTSRTPRLLLAKQAPTSR